MNKHPNKAKEWFESLRAKLIKTIESHDGNRFKQKSWKHSGEGGGQMSLIKGNIIELIVELSSYLNKFISYFAS